MSTLRYRDIPQFTREPSYGLDVAWDYLPPKTARSVVFVASLGRVRQGSGTHGIYVNWEDLQNA